MLETIERIAGVAGLPLSAQPNAGRPRDIDGRNIYLTSPEYMASYARRFVTAGVRLVGGCCGTTPEHIRQIKGAVGRSGLTPTLVPARRAPRGSAMEAPARVIPVEQRSSLARALSERRFVVTAALPPPKGHRTEDVIARARSLRSHGVDTLLIPDGPRGARMSNVALAVLVQQAGIEVVLQYSCRERTLLGMESDLLGAHAMGVRNLMLVTGDVRPVGDYANATVAFEVDSVGLTNAVSRMNEGLDIGGQTIGEPTAFHIGVQVNPGADDIDEQLRRIEYKVGAGAEFAVTTPIFDVVAFERFFQMFEKFRLPLVASIWPFDSAEHAEFMANEIPETRVPAAVVERLRTTDGAERTASEGVTIACEVASRVRGAVQGLHIAAPSGRPQSVLDVLIQLGDQK